MQRLAVIFMMLVVFAPVSSASADWRWAEPKFKLERVKPVCKFKFCKTLARAQAKANLKVRVKAYNKKKLKEWRKWTRLYIPACTWYGESGEGPEYARYRYTTPNSEGSDAFGKFQFMPGTYFANAKYGDWSPLDQEIAARREFWKHGIQPWTNCTS